MNIRRIKFMCFLSLFSSTNLFAISMVYNFRIAQITRPGNGTKPHKMHTLLALLFDQYRKKYSGIRQNFGGGLASYIYDFRSNYFRIDSALAHIHEKEQGATTFSGTETDDLLFSAGQNFQTNPVSSLTLSGLFGLPTHRLYRLQHVDFGYSQVGLGLQLDGVYSFEHKGSLMYGARYIYFVPRSARDCADQIYRFTIGNINDFLFAYKNKWHKHGFELGYTAKFRYGAHVSPDFDDIVRKSNYIRSNFYAVYKYKFTRHDHAHRLLWYLSYGLDHKPKDYGNKDIVTLWGSWSIGF
jgi:hypothetical protein